MQDYVNDIRKHLVSFELSDKTRMRTRQTSKLVKIKREQ